MDDTDAIEDKVTVGERLRLAREEKKLSLEDVAAQTRIPRRHLESLEASDWERLPAPTYTVGFAKSYAAAIGLDRVEIGDQLREEMGGLRPASTATEVFEPADPARTMPKWLVFGAIGAILLLVLVMTWLNNRSLEPADLAAPAEQPVTAPPTAPATAPPAAQGPVVLTAVAPAWIQVTDQGKTLFMGELAPGQTYSVPATAIAPLLKAGKPEALRINVGSAVAPPVGPAGVVASKVSLLPADLMKGPEAATAAPAVQTLPPPARPASQPTTRTRTRTQTRTAPEPRAEPPPAAPPAVEINAG